MTQIGRDDAGPETALDLQPSSRHDARWVSNRSGYAPRQDVGRAQHSLRGAVERAHKYALGQRTQFGYCLFSPGPDPLSFGPG
jgi:hypothetical protein